MASSYPTSLDDFFGSPTANGETITAAMFNDPWDAIDALEEKVGITSSADDTSLDYKVNNFFVENTRRLYFYENTAPTGWTYYSTVNDCVLALKGGSDAYNVTAGNGTGYGTSWANLKAHVHGLNSHVHSGPSHNHQWYNYVSGATYDQVYDSSGNAMNIAIVTESGGAVRVETGSAPGPDQDWYTANAGTGNTGAASGNTEAQNTSDARPYAAVGILATYTGA